MLNYWKDAIRCKATSQSAARPSACPTELAPNTTYPDVSLAVCEERVEDLELERVCSFLR